jgi:histidine ammonia-lyase
MRTRSVTPQVHGPVLGAIDFAAGVIGRELNAATDNPLVFENGELLSGGNSRPVGRDGARFPPSL